MVERVLFAPGGATEAKQDAQLAQDAREATQARRLGGGKIAVPFTITLAASPFVYTPASGKKVQLFWITASPDPTGGVFPRISVTLGATEVYRVRGALGHWEFFEGAVDAPMTVSISANATVDGTAHILEV